MTFFDFLKDLFSKNAIFDLKNMKNTILTICVPKKLSDLMCKKRNSFSTYDCRIIVFFTTF